MYKITSDDLSYEALWQAYQKERRSNEMQLLPVTFYSDVKELIKRLGAEAQREEVKEQTANAAKLLEGIREKRKQKIMMYAAYGRPIPEPAPKDDINLYENATGLLKNGAEKAGNVISKHKLKAMQSIPEIILPSGRKFGPVEKDQVIDIEEKSDMMFLVDNQICREVQ